MTTSHRSYRERLADIDAGLAMAKARGDTAAVTRIRAKRRKIVTLYQATGRHSDADRGLGEESLEKELARLEQRAKALERVRNVLALEGKDQ